MAYRLSSIGLDEDLPHPDAPDLDGRIERLEALLKAAPLTPDGDKLFEKAAASLASLEGPKSQANPHYAMCLLLLTRHRFYRGDAFSGLETASRAVEVATASGDYGIQARAHKLHGAMHLETGNYPNAITSLSRALHAAKLAQDREQQVGVLSNLGLAYQYSGHYSDAIPCYERASEIADLAEQTENDVWSRASKATALSNLALACLHMREYQRGITAADRAAKTLDVPADLHERVIRAGAESYFTRLLIEVHSLATARERASYAREFAYGTTDLAQMFADMALGLVEVHDSATVDVGLSRLQGAVDRSRKGTASTLRDALAAIVRGYEIAGQPNSALVYLHEVVDLNRDSRVKNVLLHHKRHVQSVRKRADIAAAESIDAKMNELKVQRLSIETLRECMLVLEQNTVAAELHDDDTGEHCYRVGALAKELAITYGMDDEMCVLVDLSARLHDIGKLRVPDSILLKPGKFTPSEREIMETHTRHGWELIGQASLGQLFVAQEIALNHHERWDGQGYPNKRKGTMIPLAARVTALADVFDALTHRRCYKPAWSVEDALREIGSLRGAHFDPELTDIFIKLVPDLQRRYGDLDLYLGREARKNDFVNERERVAREIKTAEGTFDVRR